MAENAISEATDIWNGTLKNMRRTFADSVVAAQERNLRYGQSIFENGLEVLTSHVQETRSITHTLVEQSQRQQEVFHDLHCKAMEASMRFFSPLYSSYFQMFKVTESMTWQGIHAAQKAVHEGVSVAQAAMHEGQEATR